MDVKTIDTLSHDGVLRSIKLLKIELGISRLPNDPAFFESPAYRAAIDAVSLMLIAYEARLRQQADPEAAPPAQEPDEVLRSIQDQRDRIDAIRKSMARHAERDECHAQRPDTISERYLQSKPSYEARVPWWKHPYEGSNKIDMPSAEQLKEYIRRFETRDD